MRARFVVLAVGLIVTLSCNGGPSSADIAAADARVRAMATCLDDVADGILDMTLEPEYSECVMQHLGGNGFVVINNGGRLLAERVRDLLSEREQEFQGYINIIRSAETDLERTTTLGIYSAHLRATAAELRELL